MYHICFYVPVEQSESVKEAMFAAGAGRLGAYESCSWQTLGEGQFRPLKGSRPFLGEQDKVEKVPEFKVEMVCDAASIQKVIAALHDTHPYETPAYHVVPCEAVSWHTQR